MTIVMLFKSGPIYLNVEDSQRKKMIRPRRWHHLCLAFDFATSTILPVVVRRKYC